MESETVLKIRSGFNTFKPTSQRPTLVSPEFNNCPQDGVFSAHINLTEEDADQFCERIEGLWKRGGRALVRFNGSRGDPQQTIIVGLREPKVSFSPGRTKHIELQFPFDRELFKEGRLS